MKNRITLTGILLSALLAGSCSVKEDRAACPLRMTVDAVPLKPFDAYALTLVSHPKGLVQKEIPLATGDGAFGCDINRGKIKAGAFCGFDRTLLTGTRVMIPKGKPAPLIMGSMESGDFHRDSATVNVKPNRQSALVHFSILTNGQNGGNYSIILEGDVCGTDLLTLRPVKGEFSHTVRLDKDRKSSFYLPRQDKDSCLDMHIMNGGMTVDSIFLDRLILNSGYDWNADDLQDIHITYDKGRMDTTLIICDWEGNRYEYKF